MVIRPGLASKLLIVAVIGLRLPQAPIPVAGGAPIVSPDGRHVVFHSGTLNPAGLYVANVDGSAVTPLRLSIVGARPTWSADGNRLFVPVMKKDTVFVYAFPAQGGDATLLGTTPAHGAKGGITVSRDGSRVVYGVGDWTAMQLTVARVGRDDGRQVTPGAGAFWCPRISPDGRYVAAGRRDSTRQMQIWVMDMDSRSARAVSHFTAAEGNPECPDWSADGGRIAVQSAAHDPADSTRVSGNIWIIDIMTGAAIRLAPHDAPYLDELPSWFPDGKRIAFQSNRTGRWEVWTMNTDGTGVRRLMP
jgi:TolB protein